MCVRTSFPSAHRVVRCFPQLTDSQWAETRSRTRSSYDALSQRVWIWDYLKPHFPCGSQCRPHLSSARTVWWHASVVVHVDCIIICSCTHLSIHGVPDAVGWMVLEWGWWWWRRVMNRGTAAAVVVSQRWPRYTSVNWSRTWSTSPSPVYKGSGPNARRPTISRSRRSAL